jgi:hypothetical protein
MYIYEIFFDFIGDKPNLVTYSSGEIPCQLGQFYSDTNFQPGNLMRTTMLKDGFTMEDLTLLM